MINIYDNYYINKRFDNQQYYLTYEDLRLAASSEPSYENPLLTKFTYTMSKISCKFFFL